MVLDASTANQNLVGWPPTLRWCRSA